MIFGINSLIKYVIVQDFVTLSSNEYFRITVQKIVLPSMKSNVLQ